MREPSFGCSSDVFQGTRAGRRICLGRLVVLTFLVFVGTPGSGHADWFVTPFIGVKFAADTNFVDLEEGASNTKALFGVSGGFVGDGLIGFEGEFGYAPRFFERSASNLVARSNVLTLMGNVILTAPLGLTGYALRPFLSGGAGLIHVGIDDVLDVFDVDSDLFGINIGGGATGGLTARTSVRFELRYFKSVGNEDDRVLGSTSLSFWRAAAGLTIR